jgi:hypothetical protein
MRKAGTAAARPRKNSFSSAPREPLPKDPDRRIIKMINGSGRNAAINNTVVFIDSAMPSFCSVAQDLSDKPVRPQLTASLRLNLSRRTGIQILCPKTKNPSIAAFLLTFFLSALHILNTFER